MSGVGRRPSEGWSTPVDVLVTLAVIAAVATVILTGAAFWLSYERLHDVAAGHGLVHSPERSWAWPATVDLFIVVGEVLILRASLRRTVDPWAIALTVAGSGGSIALNVAGVGAHAEAMDYVVAAVPPVAALLAFGALMRQLHGALAARMAAVTNGARAAHVAHAGADGEHRVLPPRPNGSPPGVDGVSAPVHLCPPVVYANRVDGVVRALYGQLFARPNTSQMTNAMTGVGIEPKPSTARTARQRVEEREPHLAKLPTALAATGS